MMSIGLGELIVIGMILLVCMGGLIGLVVVVRWLGQRGGPPRS